MPGKRLKAIAFSAAALVLTGGVLYLIQHTRQEYYRKITIGRDTTFVTGPKFPDGRVDYLSSVNQRLSEGVTLENNALVPLYGVINPKDFLTGWRLESFCRAIGVKGPPDPKDCYLDFGDYMLDKAVHAATHPQQVRNIEGDLRMEWDDLLDSRAKAPWKRADDPDVSAWLEHNSRVLDQVMEASRRDHYFAPLITRLDLGDVMNASVGPVGAIRRLTTMLAVRSMQNLGSGDFDAWRQDVLAQCRLGTLLTHSGTLIEMFVGMAIVSEANDSMASVLKTLPPAEARRLLDDLKTLPQPADITDCVDQYDRLGIIGEVSKMAYFGPAVVDVTNDPADPLPKPASLGFQAPVHFDELLRQYNGLMDRYVAAGRLPTFSQRQATFAGVDAYCRSMLAKATGTSTTAAIERLIFIPREGLQHESAIQDTMRQKSRLTKLALLLTLYRDEHGGYPQTLADLGNPPEAGDIFADDQPVHYEPNARLIYSAGPNQRDDKGILTKPKDTRTVNQMLSGTHAMTADYPDDIAIKLP